MALATRCASRGSAGDAVIRPFVLAALLFLVGAGVQLALEGGAAFRSSWAAATLALTHVGTLGFLTLALVGLVYQVAPDAAGRPIPGRRLPPVVLALLVSGIAALAWSLHRDARWAVLTCLSTLAPALSLFIAPIAWALRARRAAPDATSLLLALAGLLAAGVLGLWMLHGHGGMRFPGPRGLWIQAHLSVALLGWVGGLQETLVRRFARAQRSGFERLAKLRLTLLGIGLVLPILVLVLALVGTVGAGARSTSRLAALGALPAALSVWLLLPVQLLRNRAGTQRRDGPALLLDSSLALAPLTGIAAVAVFYGAGNPWRLLLGWVAIWGWAGMLTHSALLHTQSTPPAQGALGFWLHLATLIAGALAIVTGSAWVAHGVGLMLIATALQLGRCLAPWLGQRAT